MRRPLVIGVAGGSGSGKSTLLHALITNMAMSYGPDESEVYLVDFKQGVEFNALWKRTLPLAPLDRASAWDEKDRALGAP